jgi:molecular chaperone GrpE
MTDIKQTVEEQPDGSAASPGGDAAEGCGEAKSHRSGAPSGAASGAASGEVAEDRPVEGDGVSEIEGDLDELIATAAQRDEYLALAQRTQADFENYRKRVARESAGAKERGLAALAKELLPALDNLDRALEDARAASAGDASDDPLLAGVRLVRSELSAALARVGIESFSPVGEVFDPALHEAMATTDRAAEDAPSGTIVEVYQPGYRLGASIIRPARVVVAA